MVIVSTFQKDREAKMEQMKAAMKSFECLVKFCEELKYVSHGLVELQCQIMSFIHELWRSGLLPPLYRVVLILALLLVSLLLIPL